MPETYYLCNSCDRIFDEANKLVNLPDDKIKQLTNLKYFDCADCLKYANWENAKYFNLRVED